MDLKLNVSKKGLSTTEEVINEEYTLRYGHIFRGPKGDSGEKGETGAKGDNGKSPKISDNGTWLVYSDELKTFVDTGIKASGSDNNYTDADKALVQTIPNKVDKVEGKGLSTNDFTDEYKQKVDEITIDTGLSPTSDNAIANSAVVKGLAGLAEGVSEAIGNVAKNVEQNTADIKTKQDTLTLTTKPNGNIVIGNLAGQSKEFMPATPSGDPMHYVYLSYYGVSYNEQTNLYTVGYLTDLTADDMRKSFAMYGGGVMSAAYNSWVSSWSEYESLQNQLPRTTLPVFGNGSRLFFDKIHLNFCWNKLEQISLFYIPSAPNVYNCLRLWQYDSAELLLALSGMQKLKYIVDPLWCNMSHTINTFNSLPALVEIRLFNLQSNVSFEESTYFSKESLLYMINNCASNATFTITLHPDVYAKCTRVDEGEGQYEGEWWAEIDEALGYAVESKNTNITLASA